VGGCWAVARQHGIAAAATIKSTALRLTDMTLFNRVDAAEI
jgi:hypothetical protein